MRKGRMQCLALVALAAVLIASLPGSTRAAARNSAGTRVERVAKARSADESSSSRKAANALRQFTGYVSAIDKSSLTVEKRGKKPETRVFTRHDEMRTTGEIEKDARVTVYYREEGGKAVAHRVVAKPARSGSSSRS